MFFPLVYVLTCDRTTATYNIIFSKLKEAEPLLNPRIIMVDFEKAAMEAVKESFPDTTVKGWYFHFCQCIFRHVQRFGLQAEYQKNANCLQHIRCIAALAFIPTADVCKSFNSLKEFAFFKNKLRQKKNNGYHDLFKYVEETWIGRVNDEGQYTSGRFTLESWNMYEMVLNGLPRTNNATEGWHISLRHFLGASHPQIYKFIDGIKKEQATQEVTMAQVVSGHPPKKGLKKFDDLTKRLKTIVKTYPNPELFQFKSYLDGVFANIHFST